MDLNVFWLITYNRFDQYSTATLSLGSQVVGIVITVSGRISSRKHGICTVSKSTKRLPCNKDAKLNESKRMKFIDDDSFWKYYVQFYTNLNCFQSPCLYVVTASAGMNKRWTSYKTFTRIYVHIGWFCSSSLCSLAKWKISSFNSGDQELHPVSN